MNRIEILEKKVRNLYESKNPNRADWSDWLYENHVFLVAEEARKIALRYNIDPELSEASGMLHDIADALIKRTDKNHENETAHISKKFLEESGFTNKEIEIIVDGALKSHGCRNNNLPITQVGKVLATADAVVHLTSAFYDMYKSKLLEEKYSIDEINSKATLKINRDFNDKILFSEIRQEMKNNYMSLIKNFEVQKNKKILIFNLMYYPNPISGAESAIKDITERIPENEIEFHMITGLWNSNLPKVEKIGHVTVHRIGFGIPNPTATDFKTNRKLNLNKYLFQITSPFYAMYLHRKYNYDAIWGMMAHSVGIACGIFKTFNPKVKYILSLQEGDPIEHIERIAKKGGALSWFLFKRGFTLADKIQSISVYLADWAKKMTDNKREIVIVRDGANPNDMSGNFDPKLVEELKIKLNKKENEIYLVNTSRIEHQKGHDLTIKSLQFLPENFKYIIVGDGNKQDEYQKLAEDLSLKDRVIFTGRVDRSVVTAYRKLCDIFVAPSRTEGQGHAFNSAMASRLPLVTTGAGGIKEYAFDNETAWIVPQEDPEAIAKKVLEIVNDTENTKEIVEKARKLMEEEYDWDKIAVVMKEKVFNL